MFFQLSKDLQCCHILFWGKQNSKLFILDMYHIFKMGWKDLKPWLKWTLIILGYLSVGLLILIALFSILFSGPSGDMPIGRVAFLLFFGFFWFFLGILLLFIFVKGEKYWLIGMVIGILFSELLGATVLIFPFESYIKIIAKLSGWTTWPFWMLIGALIGYIVGKLKKI